jgi:hypothetical protein
MQDETKAIKKIRRRTALMRALVLLPGLTATAHAQQSTTETIRFHLPEVSATYDIERAKIANSPCSCFWLQGGSSEAAVPFYPGWSVVGSFAGSHASHIQPGVDVSRLTWLIGPRFTYDSSRIAGRLTGGRESHLFGEFLAGGAHGFDGTFPAPSGVTPSADSYALLTGGGLEFSLGGGLNLRAVEVDYVRTALPNSATNTQNNLHLAFGLAYAFSKSTR